MGCKRAGVLRVLWRFGDILFPDYREQGRHDAQDILDRYRRRGGENLYGTANAIKSIMRVASFKGFFSRAYQRGF
ncbi:MAG: hypothetical protein JSW08_03005 [archaeon]|nr:MAG: hypothetical protein JSW08_03005 [archaeon]